MAPRTISIIFAIKALFLLGCPVFGLETGYFKQKKFSEGEVKLTLRTELDNAKSGRLQSLESTLRKTFTSLPKNSHGNLGHQTVRYFLHRRFVQQHGWFIRGLEPNGETWHHDEQSAEGAKVKEWVPSFLQEVLEKGLGSNGTSLRELAALTATLEDLIREEAEGRLESAYSLHKLPTDRPNPRKKIDEAMTTFYINYLLSGNLSVSSLSEALYKTHTFETRYTGWKSAKHWLDDLENKYMTGKEDELISFNTTKKIAAALGEEYYQFNDLECKDLKSELSALEGLKAGRVRLPAFYKKGLHSHWRFTEKADYLKTLGALDDTDPKNPQVILTNYIMARPNCLEPSSLYAICCRNECEDLMGHLEGEIGGSEASPNRIAELVAALPSDTVTAPRRLSTSLRDRLDEVAAVNGGKVPLHGRLFAQWMHHAYPRECPYPHEQGLVSPQTPDEWMQENGQSSSELGTEELMEHVAADTCAADAAGKFRGKGCGDDEPGADELPWSAAEELLHQQVPKRSNSDIVTDSTQDVRTPSAAEEPRRMAAGMAVEDATPDAMPAPARPDDAVPGKASFGPDKLALCAAFAILGYLIFDQQLLDPQEKSLGSLIRVEEDYSKVSGNRALSGNRRKMLILCVIALLIYAVDFLDKTLFLMVLCCGLVGYSVACAMTSKSAEARANSKLAPMNDGWANCV